ncbi:MAG: YceH family protein [Gaiellaceae bacterium]
MAVRPFGLSPEQIRVLGALVEKAATTPETYPLSSNALRTACNQRSSRDPVVEYDEGTVTAAMLALRERELAKTIRGAGSRVFKHAHALDRLELGESEIAALSVLLLRGPQTIGEIKTRCERQHRFASLEEVEAALSRLVADDEPLVVRLERAPGQKEARWRHLLDNDPYGRSAPSIEEAGAEPQLDRPDRGDVDPEQPRATTSPAHAGLAREADARTQTLEEITQRIEALEENLAEIQRQLDTDRI